MSQKIVPSPRWGQVVIGLAMLFAWTSCQPKQEIPTINPAESELQFTGTLPGDVGLRAHGTSWDRGDKIGIIAYDNTKTLDKSSIIDGYDNLPYITRDGSGRFTAEGTPIKWLTDGRLMNMVAYYPYRSDIVNYQYPINLTEQKDVFYSNNVNNIGDYTNQISLQFGHVLSQLRLNVSTPNGAVLDGLEVTVVNTPLKAKFSLIDGRTFTVDATSNGSFPLAEKTSASTATEKKYEGMLLPGQPAKSIIVRFTLGGKTYDWAVPVVMEQGKFYTYNIKLDKVVSAVIIQTGVPEMPYYASNDGKAPNSIRVMHMVSRSDVGGSPSQDQVRNYSVLYDTKNGLPYWVAYPLHSMYIGNSGRSEAWDYDPKINSAFQPNLNSGWATKGYDRGHMNPSGDRTASRALNVQTFYFSNMSPQIGPKMNQGPWNDLEQAVRGWQQYIGDTVYIVTGNILPTDIANARKVKDKSGRSFPVPDYCYKLLMHKTKSGAYKTIGFKMANTTSAPSYSECIVSVESLEKETGFVFFPTIPVDQAVKAKQNTSLSDFKTR